MSEEGKSDIDETGSLNAFETIAHPTTTALKPPDVSTVAPDVPTGGMQESFTHLDHVVKMAVDDEDLDRDDLSEIRTHMTSPSFVSVHSLDHGAPSNGNGAGDFGADDVDMINGEGEHVFETVKPPLPNPQDYVIIYPHGGYEDSRPTLRSCPPEFGLEKALEARIPTILIYAEPLGEHTSRWIRLGNFLHKTAVLAGFCSAVASAVALKKLAQLEKRGLGTYAAPQIGFGGPSPSSSAYFWRGMLRPSTVFKHVSFFDGPKTTDPLGLSNVLNGPRMSIYLAGILLGTGALCTLIYTASWQFDPCCKYQILTKAPRSTLGRRYPPNHPIHRLLSGSAPQTPPVVLIYRNDGKRKTLHYTITALATGLSLLAVYRLSRLN